MPLWPSLHLSMILGHVPFPFPGICLSALVETNCDFDGLRFQTMFWQRRSRNVAFDKDFKEQNGGFSFYAGSSGLYGFRELSRILSWA